MMKTRIKKIFLHLILLIVVELRFKKDKINFKPPVKTNDVSMLDVYISQETIRDIMESILEIFRASQALGYIPKAWRDYSCVHSETCKGHILPSQIMLKTMEKLIHLYTTFTPMYKYTP